MPILDDLTDNFQLFILRNSCVLLKSHSVEEAHRAHRQCIIFGGCRSAEFKRVLMFISLIKA